MRRKSALERKGCAVTNKECEVYVDRQKRAAAARRTIIATHKSAQALRTKKDGLSKNCAGKEGGAQRATFGRACSRAEGEVDRNGVRGTVNKKLRQEKV